MIHPMTQAPADEAPAEALILSDREVYASKVHRCDCCGEDIRPGMRYRRIAFINERGDFQEVKVHIPRWQGDWNGGGKWHHKDCRSGV